MKNSISWTSRTFLILWLLAAAALLILSTPAILAGEAPSDGRQLWICVTILSLSEDGNRAVGEKTVLPPEVIQNLIDTKKARQLETLRFSLRGGQETGTFIGHKFPITYFDPKPSFYQIVFVDVGMKFSIKPVIAAGERLNIEIKPSISTIEDYRQEVERDTVFYFPSVKTVDSSHVIEGIKSGETAIISNLQGLSLEDVLKDLGEKATFYGKGSRLIIAITPYILPGKTAAPEAKNSRHPSVIEMKTLRLSPAASKKHMNTCRLSEESLSSLVKSGDAKIIDSYRILSSAGESDLGMGRKYPLAYFDPRSGSYQVIYINIGMNGVVKCTPAGADMWNLNVKKEYSNADPASLFGVKRDQIPLKIYTIKTDASLELGTGEIGIILGLRGEYYYKLIKDVLFPGIEFSPDDELIFTVTVR